MPTDTEKGYLVKAFYTFRKKLLIVSPDFKVLAANNASLENQREKIIGRLCHKALYNRPSPCKRCPAQEVIRTRHPAMQDSQKGYLGMERAACLYSYPIFSEDTLEAIVMLDFEFPTLVEGLEEKLRRSNAFLRNLILSSVDGVVAADKAGKILMFNDAAAKISGYGVKEALDKLNIRNLYPNQGAWEIMRQLRSEENSGKGKLKSCQVDVLQKDGGTIPISLDAAVVYEGKAEVATIGFFHDMRETLRMKAELERTQLQLLQAEKMASLGKLAAGVAHQLNNPLGGITLFTKLILEEYDLDDDIREDLDRILRDAQRCRDTVKELLEFARQTRYNIQPHDINKAITRTLFLLENQSLFQNIEIKKTLTKPLPPVPVDIQQINHLFMNIILNAAQAMKGKGNLKVETGLKSGGERILVEISDTGPGIPEEILSQIFDPFFTTKEEGKGTGLGLSLAYGIVEKHGGTILARSQVGKGTTFSIELPVATRG